MELNQKLNVDKLESVKNGCAMRVPVQVIADQASFWEEQYKILFKKIYLKAQNS